MTINLPPSSLINFRAAAQKEMSSDKWVQDLKAARSAKHFPLQFVSNFTVNRQPELSTLGNRTTWYVGVGLMRGRDSWSWREREREDWGMGSGLAKIKNTNIYTMSLKFHFKFERPNCKHNLVYMEIHSVQY